jgi:hypothetical protein
MTTTGCLASPRSTGACPAPHGVNGYLTLASTSFDSRSTAASD